MKRKEEFFEPFVLYPVSLNLCVRFKIRQSSCLFKRFSSFRIETLKWRKIIFVLLHFVKNQTDSPSAVEYGPYIQVECLLFSLCFVYFFIKFSSLKSKTIVRLCDCELKNIHSLNDYCWISKQLSLCFCSYLVFFVDMQLMSFGGFFYSSSKFFIIQLDEFQRRKLYIFFSNYPFDNKL